MRLKGSPAAKANARHQRRQMSPPWQALRKSPDGHRFRRQHPAGSYSLDFYCAPARLAIEVDGAAHSAGDRPERDEARDVWLRSQGVEIRRYSSIEVMCNLDGVVRDILAAAAERRDG